MQEHELVKNIQAGDIRAFKMLFENYHSNVFNLCLKLVGNRVEAEDLCQDIFIKIYQSIDNFEFKAKLSTWIYRIAVNVCLNHQRSKKRVQFLRLDHRGSERCTDVFDLLVNPPGEQPDVSLEQKEKEKIVWDAIHSLPESQRLVLILQRYEGLSCEQMAQVLRSSVSSVQSRLFRAKENLAKKLLPYLDKI
ncbi:MAG: RNA polymerase sigma factor [Candidatus Zhuqueibacterota bacterium]